MDLLSLLDQREKNHVLIIRRVLMNGGKMTVSELKNNFDLTYNTLVTYLEEIEETSQMLGEGVCVIAKTNTLTIEVADDVSISVLVEHYYKQALNIRLIKLIAFSDTMTNSILSEQLAISKSSVQRRIADINQLIKEFNIEIRAHRLVGSELQIRYFYTVSFRTCLS